jgi:hypothetical protein
MIFQPLAKHHPNPYLAPSTLVKARSLPISLILCLMICTFRQGQLQAKNFIPSEQPSNADWRRFHQMSIEDLTQLWRTQGYKSAPKAPRLADWSWQWRLAWLRTCQHTDRAIAACAHIVTDGLIDKALVVRAEAVDVFAMQKKYNFTESEVKTLKAMYLREDSTRHDQPLFICRNILRVLTRSPNKYAQKAAGELSSHNPKMLAYYKGLRKVY